MKLTKPIKRSIETFIYIAVIATMIFHYGISSIIFDSTHADEVLVKWPMYSMPILLAAGLTLFIAYPIYLKSENVAESTNVEVSTELDEPDFNKSLYDHFSKLPIKQYTPSRLFHGGAHIPGKPIVGTLWMHDNAQGVEFYTRGTPNKPYKIMVLKAAPRKPLNLIEWPGSHLEKLRSIYGGDFSHDIFSKELSRLQELGKIEFDGLYRPLTKEFFILNVEKNLDFI